MKEKEKKQTRESHIVTKKQKKIKQNKKKIIKKNKEKKQKEYTKIYIHIYII